MPLRFLLKKDFLCNEVCLFKTCTKKLLYKHLESCLGVKRDIHINCIFINKEQAPSVTFTCDNVLANVLYMAIMLVAITENYKRNLTELANIKPA